MTGALHCCRMEGGQAANSGHGPDVTSIAAEGRIDLDDGEVVPVCAERVPRIGNRA